MCRIEEHEDGFTPDDWRAAYARYRWERRLASINGTAPPPEASIGIMAASRKYGIPHGTIWRWVNRGLIPVIRAGEGSGPGSATEIDERSLASIVESYRKDPGQGKRSAVAEA